MSRSVAVPWIWIFFFYQLFFFFLPTLGFVLSFAFILFRFHTSHLNFPFHCYPDCINSFPFVSPISFSCSVHVLRRLIFLLSKSFLVLTTFLANHRHQFFFKLIRGFLCSLFPSFYFQLRNINFQSYRCHSSDFINWFAYVSFACF